MNINEIARLAGVSRATVSRYLNNGYVSSEKKEVIRRVIQETGYQPSSQAQTLRTKKTSLIGVILPKINSDTISREVTGISDILTRRGYQLILANTNNDVEEELKYLSLFKERQVDGVVFIATMFTRKHKQMLKDYKVPIVILGQHLDGYPCIYQDDHKAAFQVTEKLAEKGKKFAYIGVTDKDEAVGACRKKGFMDAIHKAKLEVVPERMKIGSFTMDSGYEMAKELFEEEPSIDSLVCATDTMAVGAMTYLKEIGLRIPEDVQIAGIGDGVPGKIVEPKLTTVHFYYKTSGMEAAAMLADLIENDTGISKEIKMGWELVEREAHREQRISSQTEEEIISYCGTGADLLGEKDLLLFVWCCVMAEQTQKNARFFLRCPDWFVCLASVLMEYVQF